MGPQLLLKSRPCLPRPHYHLIIIISAVELDCVTYRFEARCDHVSCFIAWRMSRKLFRGSSDMRQVKTLRTSMLLTTLCFTAVSHMPNYKQCVLQKKYNWGCSHLQPLHCSMGEKGPFVLWNHWIGRIFITTAKAMWALFSYSTFLYCSYIVLITLIKTIMEGKDKVTVWSTTDFPCNSDTLIAHHSHVVLCLPVPCLGNGTIMVGNKYTILGTDCF